VSPGISTIVARRIRHSYGVLMVEQFNANLHSSSDEEWDSYLKQPVVRRIRWLLKRVLNFDLITRE
jgi:hypothetical protein